MRSDLRPITAVAVVVGVAAVAFWRGTLDVFGTTKATAVVLGALALGVAALAVALRDGRLTLPWGPWPAAVAVMAVGLVGGVAASDSPMRSVVGVPGRHGGLALYVACLVLGLLAAHAIRRPGAVDRLTAVLGLASVGVIGYLLLQAAGLDPFPWGTVEGGVPWFSTFGNVDFASAWIGIVGVLVAGVAVDGDRGVRVRQAAGALVVLAVVAAVLTGSLQGPVVLGLGLPVVVAAALIGQGRRSAGGRLSAGDRRAARGVLAAGGLLLVLGVAVLAGPGRGLVGDAGRSLETRIPKWEAALVMAGDAPLLGHGLDLYGDRWFAARAPDTAAVEGLDRSVDNAHSVPLHLLAGGGILLAGGWLAAFTVVPAIGVWRTYRRSTPFGVSSHSARRGASRHTAGGASAPTVPEPPTAALVMAWAGYVVCSLVSIDVPPMAALGALLTGAVAGTTGMARTRAVDLAVPAPARLAGTAVVVLTALAAVVPLTAPLRADALGFRAEIARLEGRRDAGQLAGEAAATAPWASRYPADHGAWLTGQGLLEVALDAQVEALQREPRSLTHALNVARLLAGLGQDAAARQAYDRVLQIDPHTPAVQQEAAALGPPAPADPTAGQASGPASGPVRSGP